MSRAVDVVRRFRHLRALAIGDAMLDTYLEGTAARLCTEGPVPVVRKTAERRVPGGAANAAANLRALGAEVLFVGVVGTDIAGSILRMALRERGVDDRWLVADEGASTLHKMRILADGQYVVRFDDEEPHAYAAESERRLIARLDEAWPHADVVVVSDYGYGALSDRVIARMRELRADHPRPLLVDSKALRRFRTLGATIITPNQLEARLVVAPDGMSHPLPRQEGGALAEVEHLGRELLALIDAEHAAITMASDGVMLVGREGPALHVPAHRVPHAYDVGAGDSFAAALALALGAGADTADAARIACDAAGIAVTRRWTSVVPHHELLQRVSLRDDASTANAAGDGRQRALARLVARLDYARQAGKTIVFTNGVFDILHAGHVTFLREAKALGDLLVVGVNSDQGAQRLKGKNRPINSEHDRLALVAALDAVDDAILFDEETPAALIRLLRPDVHVKGGDYADEALPEAEAVREVGGRVVIVPLAGSLSTTRVIERIVARAWDERIGAER
jgi:D-beta-D-heptose 7-phosphate kinase / D-beta-D-heptose 1-phosphate adenosyltransferase